MRPIFCYASRWLRRPALRAVSHSGTWVGLMKARKLSILSRHGSHRFGLWNWQKFEWQQSRDSRRQSLIQQLSPDFESKDFSQSTRNCVTNLLVYFRKRANNAVAIWKGLQTQELSTCQLSIFPVKGSDGWSRLGSERPRRSP